MINKLNKSYFNLDLDFYDWIVPRLKILKANQRTYPVNVTLEQWNIILDEMIKGFS